MSLDIKNTRALCKPESFFWKVLIVALPGSGKSTWVATVPNIGVAACETGHGSGLASIAASDIDYVTPTNYQELEAFCSGNIFKEKSALGLDSLSAMTRTFIKDYALKFPRRGGETLKRQAGIPELDDYGVIAECTRRLLAKLIDLPKHIVVTCTLKPATDAYPEEGKEAMPAMPDLPGQLALASAAMFDSVMIMRTRPMLRDPKNAKSRYNQRYLMTQQTDKWLAKSRLTEKYGKPFLAEEEVFDLDSGAGSFPYLLDKILRGLNAEVAVNAAATAALG